MIVGGGGAKRTPRLAATYAAEFNMPFALAWSGPAEQFGRVREACGADRARARAVGRAGRCAAGATRPRSPAGPPRSAATSTSCARTGWRARPAEVVDRLGRFAEAGATRVYLQVLDLSDLDHLELVAREVMPQLG